MSVVIRLKVPIEMHYAVIPMGTSKVNSSHNEYRMFQFAGRNNLRNHDSNLFYIGDRRAFRDTKYRVQINVI